MPFTKWIHSFCVHEEDAHVTPSHAFVFAEDVLVQAEDVLVQAEDVLVQAEDEVGHAGFVRAPTQDADMLAALVRGMD